IGEFAMNMLQRYPIILGMVLLFVCFITMICSTMYGATTYSFSTVWKALVDIDVTNMDQLIIRNSRIPRVIGALLVGAFIAISGALMQGLTRNYLASPSIIGVSDGSIFVITLCMVFI